MMLQLTMTKIYFLFFIFMCGNALKPHHTFRRRTFQEGHNGFKSFINHHRQYSSVKIYLHFHYQFGSNPSEWGLTANIFARVLYMYSESIKPLCVLHSQFERNSVVSEIFLLLPNSPNGRIHVPKCDL